MKLNWKVFLGNKLKLKTNSARDKDALPHDMAVDFYYANLLNALRLFSMKREELDDLASPAFSPMFELETEIDYAFMPVCFESIFRNKLVDLSLKTELLQFKEAVDNMPKELWNWDLIDEHHTWIAIRQQAHALLEKLGATTWAYNDDFTTIYNRAGKLLKQAKTGKE